MNCPETGCSERRGCFCANGGVCFLVLVIALAVGLILGAVYAETILPAIAAIIAFIAAVAAVLIALLVYCYFCRRRRR